MRIAIVNLTNGGLSGGYRKYLEKLIPLLEEDPRVESLEVFGPPLIADSIKFEQIRLHTWPAINSASVYSWLKTTLRRHSPDVVFIPTARWLNCGRIPVVTMVRNMEPLVTTFNENSLKEKVKNLARARVARRACQRSHRVIAVSQYVQDFLVQNWGLSTEGIGVVPHGIQPPPAPSETVRPKMIGNNTDNIIFTAGSIRPARGLADIIKAMALIREQGLPFTLVIGGKADPGTDFYKERMMQLAAESGVAPRIIWAGQLTSLEMSWCFYHCDLFVMTSRVEACPNIVLEAMSHGCLCVSTDQPPMPEFFGPGAFYYHAGDASSLAKCLLHAVAVTDSEKQRKRMVAHERANHFDWGATASATISQLELVL